MLTILLVIIGLSILILSHEAGHFFVARWFKLKIDEFGFGFPPRIFAKKKGETEYSINALPFGGFVRIAGENDRISGDLEKLEALPEEDKKRLFHFQPASRRALIIVAGVAVNFLIGWLLISAIFMIGTPPVVVITGIQEGSPAARVGLQEGDVVKGFAKVADFIAFVDESRGREITVTVLRGGEEMSLTTIPRREVKAGEGALGVFLAEGGVPRLSPPLALWQGLKQSVEIAGLTVVAFYRLIENLFLRATLLEGVVGPVGIFFVAQQTGELGFIYLAQLIALISINLAVINLIPFPALDGGRLLFIAIEKIKGSPVSRKVEAVANGLGFIFLMALIALITVRDIGLWVR